MTEQERKDAYKRWLQQSERLKRLTSDKRIETPEEKNATLPVP